MQLIETTEQISEPNILIPDDRQVHVPSIYTSFGMYGFDSFLETIFVVIYSVMSATHLTTLLIGSIAVDRQYLITFWRFHC